MINGCWVRTLTGSGFSMKNNRNSRIVVFANEQFLQLVTETPNISTGGTFEACPYLYKPFYVSRRLSNIKNLSFYCSWRETHHRSFLQNFKQKNGQKCNIFYQAPDFFPSMKQDWFQLCEPSFLTKLIWAVNSILRQRFFENFKHRSRRLLPPKKCLYDLGLPMLNEIGKTIVELFNQESTGFFSVLVQNMAWLSPETCNVFVGPPRIPTTNFCDGALAFENAMACGFQLWY